MRKGAAAVLLFVLTLMAAPACKAASAMEETSKRTLRLTASGSVKAAPDAAQISVGAASESETARAALDQNNAAMKQIIAELKRSGVQEEDIQTADFSVHPRYHHPKDKPPIITGYRVVNALRIMARDLSKLGEILDKVVSLGSNQIDGIVFLVSEPAQMMDEARRRATGSARHKAELYAGAAGVALGRVLTIEEHPVHTSRPVLHRMETKAAAAAPIQPGQEELQAQVTVVWELADR